jgi:predicted nucleic acid-binding protein
LPREPASSRSKKSSLGHEINVTDAAGLVFVDANVVIAASVADHRFYAVAREFFGSTTAAFASSTLLRLEVLPRALRTPQPSVREIVEGYLGLVTHWVRIDEALIAEAEHVATGVGLKALDAVHAVSARRLRALLVTTDAKAHFDRVPDLQVRLLEA